MKESSIVVFLLIILVGFTSCRKDKKAEDFIANCSLPEITADSEVEGYGILSRLPGIWNGPVYSPTPLGSFNEWIVDFRPISSSQISAKNELDSLNDIFMSFFITKIDCDYKIAFRNGGGFAGQTRNSYMIIDSVSETPSQAFYRFSDPVSGGKRVYTEVTFKQDSLIMHTYTNQYNTLTQAQTHMIWRARLKDLSSSQGATNLFGFPQKELTRDFSTTFTNLSEAVFYSAAADPYPEHQQPYLGNSQINIDITAPSTVDPSKKVLIIVTTQPLFNGSVFNPANLDYRSRYVFVGASDPTGYNFNYMHPGDYYVNAIYDSNGDFNFSSGDYINSNFDMPLTLGNKGNETVNIDINFQIP